MTMHSDVRKPRGNFRSYARLTRYVQIQILIVKGNHDHWMLNFDSWHGP